MKNKSKIIIKPVGVCDIYEIGDWVNSYPWIKLGYMLDDYQSKYFDISFYIKDYGNILGYIIAYSIVCVNNDDIIPIYSKKLVISDFAVTARAYAKYGLLLINYFIDYAKKNGFSAIEINNIDKYSFFLMFLNRHYNLIQYNDKYYIIIDNPRIKISQKNLLIYEKDNISIDDLYYLYDLKFKVLKTIAKYKINDTDNILIDRLTGMIKLPTNIKLGKDDLYINAETRKIIHLLLQLYATNESDNIIINYDLIKPNEFEVYVGNDLYVNKDIQVLYDDIEYVLKMKDKGINNIYSYSLNYNMNDSSFTHSVGGLSCDKLIEKYTSLVDSKANCIKDKINEKKISVEFNSKLKNIKRFDFRFGNSFCGIKKMSILFDEDAHVKSNGQIDKNVVIDKAMIIKELELFYFTNWDNIYNNNPKPKYENSWSIRLVLEDEMLEYIGVDDYPKCWIYVEWFINKYSRFYLEKE